jgi:hypothetical protein
MIRIYIRSPGDNIPLAVICNDRINDRCLVHRDGLGVDQLCNLGEFITMYLQDHPDAQLIVVKR